jgi:hypothetical protein
MSPDGQRFLFGEVVPRPLGDAHGLRPELGRHAAARPLIIALQSGCIL